MDLVKKIPLRPLQQKWIGCMEIVIATYCNDSYVPHMATAIRSVVETTTEDVVIRLFVLHSGVSQTVIKRAEESWGIGKVYSTWCFIDLNAFGFRPHAHITADSLSRLLVARFVPEVYTRVILLDSDIVAIESLSDLWSVQMNSNIVLAAINQDLPVASMVRSDLIDSSSIPALSPYFNAGVMVVDLHLWRIMCIEAHALDLVARYFKMARFGDQCILNVALHGLWGEIPPRWNAQLGDPPYVGRVSASIPSTSQIIAARSKPAIAHYTGEIKPWHKGCGLQHAALYHDFRCRTAFGEIEK